MPIAGSPFGDKGPRTSGLTERRALMKAQPSVVTSSFDPAGSSAELGSICLRPLPPIIVMAHGLVVRAKCVWMRSRSGDEAGPWRGISINQDAKKMNGGKDAHQFPCDRNQGCAGVCKIDGREQGIS